MNKEALSLDARIGFVHERRNIGCQFLVLALALIYGGILASLPLDVFLDRVNYLNYAENSWFIFARNLAISPLVVFANEPLWLLINTGLAMLLPSEIVLRVIIFVPASVVAWFVLRQQPQQFIWLLLFLLLPQVIGNHISHLRQGMAIAVFLMGWFSNKQPLRWLMFAAAPLIHSSYFFILVLLVATNLMLHLRLAADVRTLVFVVLGVAAGVSTFWVASFLGARQALIYDFSMTDVSGLGAVFWGVVFIVMCFQGRTFMRRHTFELGVIVFYLSTYLLLEVTGRIFEAALLLVLLAGLQLTGWRRLFFLTLISVYLVLQYIMRLDLPWLGFGAYL